MTNLKQLTELEFDKGLVSVVREYQRSINAVFEMVNDISLYKEHGHKIKYYIDNKKGTYNYFAFEPDVGFRGGKKKWTS